MEQNEATATARFVRIAPRKVKLVMDAIRGKYVHEALDLLKFTPNHAAAEIAKVISSATANASNNHGIESEYMKVVRCWVDGGPTMKRVRARAQGRAYRILKRTSHITVVVEGAEAPTTTRPREAAIENKRREPLRAPLKTPILAAAPVDETAPVEETIPMEAATVTETPQEATPVDANVAPESGAPAETPAPEQETKAE
ncbi:MAG: 50S ribosomal protein L22 [bacterium]